MDLETCTTVQQATGLDYNTSDLRKLNLEKHVNVITYQCSSERECHSSSIKSTLFLQALECQQSCVNIEDRKSVV